MRNVQIMKTSKNSDQDLLKKSEWPVLVVAVWLAAVVLLPLHGLLIYNLLYTRSLVGLIGLALIFALPLVVVDVFAYRWFAGNFSVIRWTNRSIGDRKPPA